MEYIPGNIHENFQKTHYFRLKSDFVWSNCTKRYLSFTNIEDWDNYTYQINLCQGDIIALKFFKYGDSNAYCYLEKLIFKDGGEKIYNTESSISLNFLEHNLGDKRLFQSADKIINRDKLINSIVN